MKRFGLLSLVALLTSFLWSLPAFAADVVQPTGSPLAVALSGFIDKLVFPILTAFLMGAMGLFFQRLARKHKIELSIEQQRFLEKIAYQAISYVEEYAADKLKNAQIRISSSEKLNMAIAKVLSAAPQITEEKADELVHSMLARSTGAGATGETVL